MGFSGPLGPGSSHGVSRWPLHGRVCRGGCSWVDHRLVGTAFLCHWLVLGAPFGGGPRKAGGVGGVVFGTLLGPEGSDVMSWVFQCGPHLLVVPPCLFLLGAGMGVVGAGVWWGSARMLRTTQWTRASL